MDTVSGVVAADIIEFEIMEEGVRTEYNIYKDPITDDGTKTSLKGFQFVYLAEKVMAFRGNSSPQFPSKGESVNSPLEGDLGGDRYKLVDDP